MNLWHNSESTISYKISLKCLILFFFIAGLSILPVTGISDLTSYDNSREGGTFVFQSIPSGASVFVDTVYAGSTPLTLNYVYPGQRYIQLIKEGYKDWTDTRSILNGQTDVIIASLTKGIGGGMLPPSPSSGQGMISVMSEPPGAHISLDGEIKGYAPTTLMGVLTGNHVIELTYPGYMPYQESVIVYPGKATTVRAFLVSGSYPPATPKVTTPWVTTPGVTTPWVTTLPTIPGQLQILPLPGINNPPKSIDGDSLYRDVNGNSVHDYNDVTLYSQQIEWIGLNEPLNSFDYNQNGRIDYGDVVTLFKWI